MSIDDVMDIYPCLDCNNNGDLCFCDRLTSFYQTMKEERNSMVEPIEHTCADCVHQDVCRHMNEFVAAKQAIVEATVKVSDHVTTKLLNIPCIKAVGLQCKFYRKAFQGGAIR